VKCQLWLLLMLVAISAAHGADDPVWDAYRAWQKEQPKASSQADYRKQAESLYQASGEWIRKWPDNRSAWQQRRDALVRLQSHSAEDWKQVGDGLIRTSPPDQVRSVRLGLAQDWIADAVCLEDASKELEAFLREPSPPEDASLRGQLDAAGRELTRWMAYTNLAYAGLQLKNAEQTKAALEGQRQWLDNEFTRRFDPDPRNFSDYEGRYFQSSAKFAQAEGRKLDALAYYQKLLVNPYWQYGTARIAEQARSLWKELGGSEADWKVWATPEKPKEGVPVPPHGMGVFPWYTVRLPLPDMILKDANGGKWTVGDFKGKTTLVLLWATWCGPCWMDLPKIQKAYDAVRDRRDVQVVTFSNDEDPAVVQSFLGEHHYDFPALAAKSYLTGLFTDQPPNGQLLIVDAGGVVRSQRQSMVPAPDDFWVAEVLEKLDHRPR
jgi:thiol-disulfide isomerase/thioredoxin